MKPQKFSNYSLFLIIYTLVVILWGAWVRISGSGDGCGDHWPFCQGEILPVYKDIAMVIEFLHRLSTKLYGIFVIVLVFAAFKSFPKAHAARRYSLAALAFTLIEGGIGAVLVLKGFVGTDESAARAFVMGLHLVNTFLLSSSLVLTWLSSKDFYKDPFPQAPSSSWRKWAWVLLLGWLLLSSFGALAALASTLFPSEGLVQSFLNDLSANSHFSLRLRILHPLLAVIIFGLGMWILSFLKSISQEKWHKKSCTWTQSLFIANFLFGIITLGLLSPLWMKLTHLLLTHLLWLGLTLSVGSWLLPLKKKEI